MRTLTLICLAAVLVLGSGCKKKQPSEDYSQAAHAFAVLYGAQLDAAYTNPQVDRILEQLRRVPADSLDAEGAKELIARIEGGRAKLLADRAARDAAQAELLKKQPANFPPSNDNNRPPPVEQPVVEAVDAGPVKPTEPKIGMHFSEFDKAFGDCFEPGPTISLGGAGSGSAESKMLVDFNRCRDLLPGFDQKYVLFQNGMLVNIMNRSDIQTVTVRPDGGMFDAGL